MRLFFIRVGVLGLLFAGLAGSFVQAGPAAPTSSLTSCSISPTRVTVTEGQPVASATVTVGGSLGGNAQYRAYSEFFVDDEFQSGSAAGAVTPGSAGNRPVLVS